MQSKNDNLHYMIDPTFKNINRLFVLLFISGNNDPTKSSFDKYYMPLVNIKNFNILIEKNSISDQPVEKNKKHMKNMSKCQGMVTILLETY